MAGYTIWWEGSYYRANRKRGRNKAAEYFKKQLEEKSETDSNTKPDHYETLEKKIDQMSNSNNNEFVKLYDK